MIYQKLLTFNHYNLFFSYLQEFIYHKLNKSKSKYMLAYTKKFKLYIIYQSRWNYIMFKLKNVKFISISTTIAMIFAIAITLNFFSTTNSTPDATYTLNAQAPSQSDFLTLVNWQNPIENCEDEPETTELSNGQRVDKRIYPELMKMFEDAESEGIFLSVRSGYRTNQEQTEIYEEKIKQLQNQGMTQKSATEKAQKLVAKPGHSEHQLGLAVDINSDKIHSTNEQAYQWLKKNAHKYGFIYRYPPNKSEITGVSNEPWHYRYVAKAAEEIYEKNICLEEYLEEKEGTKNL